MAQEGIGPFFQRQGMPEIVVFAGKGGLGKTTCSAALSYWYSQKDGKKTLCFSTDPQASLSDIFEKDIYGKGLVELAPNLDVVEIDADRRVRDYQQSVKQKIIDMYGLDELPAEIEEYIDSTSAEPAMYESATYDAMADLVAQRDHDLYIFDMPPFGHGVRMVAMAEILSKWVEKITEAREKAQEFEAVAATLRGQKFEAGDEVLKELTDIKAKITTFTDMLTDRKRTAFFMVLVPEKMAILDTERALEMFQRLDITLSGLILNQVYPKDLLDSPKVGEFLKNRVKAQEPYIREIKDKFGDLVVATLPMYVKEPKGMEMIAQVADDLIKGRVVV
jgi:arsenite-transporting ATPase